MQFRAPNSELIRVVVIILFFAISVIFRAKKKPGTTTPVKREGMGSPLEALSMAKRQLSEAKRRAAEDARASRRQPPTELGPFQMQEFVQQPPTIEPESSIVPSLLLFALFACLCFMAYRYFAR